MNSLCAVISCLEASRRSRIGVKISLFCDVELVRFVVKFVLKEMCCNVSGSYSVGVSLFECKLSLCPLYTAMHRSLIL